MVVYSVYRDNNLAAMFATLDAGVRKYGFIRPIFNTSYWSNAYYFTTRTPWNYLVSGTWWGSILVLGPLLIVVWGVVVCRHFSRLDAVVKRDDTGQPLFTWRRARESSR